MKQQPARGSMWRILGLGALALAGVFAAVPSQAYDAVRAQSAGQSAAAAAQAEAVFTAVKRDNRSNLVGLMVAGADVNIIGPDGQTPMTLAFQIDSMNALDALITSPLTQVDFPNRYGETPLMLAAIRGNQDALERLLRAGAAVNRPGWGALHYAASGSSDAQAAIARTLMAHGADVNARSPNGTTPLMMAAGNGTVPVVQLLLEQGADVALVNDQGLNAVAFAKNSGREPLVERIEKAQRQTRGAAAPARSPQGRMQRPQIPGSWD